MKSNPRFVWIIGAISEIFPDVPDLSASPEGMILWDRQLKREVAIVRQEYAQAVCLETKSGGMPFTNLCDWLNELDAESAESEGLTPTSPEYL